MMREEILHLLEDVLDNTQDNERALSYAIELLRDPHTCGANKRVDPVRTCMNRHDVITVLNEMWEQSGDADGRHQNALSRAIELLSGDAFTRLEEEADVAAFVRAQDSTTGVNAVIGQYPGDETDEQVEAALASFDELNRDILIAELVASLTAVVGIVEAERDYWLGNAYPEDYEAVRVAREALMKAERVTRGTEQHTTFSVKPAGADVDDIRKEYDAWVQQKAVDGGLGHYLTAWEGYLAGYRAAARSGRDE